MYVYISLFLKTQNNLDIDTSEDEAEAVSVSVSSVKRRNDKEHDANEGSKCGNSLPTLSSSSRPLKEVEVITLSDECNENEGGTIRFKLLNANHEFTIRKKIKRRRS